MNSYVSGLFSEFLARNYLRLHGFRILKKRFKTGRFTGRAEIDIIAKKENLILFVEVKKRPTITDAFNAIPRTQIKRLRTAAETFIEQRNWRGNARFDIIIITRFKIKWIKGAI